MIPKIVLPVEECHSTSNLTCDFHLAKNKTFTENA